MPREEPAYDVALSFAGEDRPFAASLAAVLRARGLQVFYDASEPDDLWGKDLSEHLRSVYSGSLVSVLLLSKASAAKPWVKFESGAVAARAAQDNSMVVLPVRLDDSKLPRLLASLIAVDARQHDVKDIADIIEKKVAVAKNSAGRKEPAPEGADYHVISRTGGWIVKVKGAGRGSRVMKTQAEAIQFARGLARRNSAHEVIVHKEDGSVQSRLSTRS